METIHIYPENDLQEHITEGYPCQCPCEPDSWYDEEVDAIFVTHNSFDGRELVEEAKRILNDEK